MALGMLVLVGAGGVASAAATQASVSSQTFQLDGKPISTEEAAKAGLACVQGAPDDVGTCFRSSAEAARATGSEAAPQRFGSGSEPAFCVIPNAMVVYENYSYGGWSLWLTGRHVWYDLTGAYNDQVSSYEMGDHSGHIASDSYAQGLGYNYPGDTGVGGCDDNMSRYPYQGATWNNKASSRYRN
ncbi:hypothetical protein [Patulibacter medicamentivorans]|uniref:hypothetical protein n=1 Tax=Patulibacter medicamentivorans TaxID=1097667 RepID=UPI00111000C7|nr:hypothetical protein [Patulibacter medicamentivorans]